MPLQVLTLKLEGITAGDYLTWCQDPDPPALDFGLRSISIDANPLGDTITAILDWSQPVPTPPTVASAAGLPLAAGVEIYALLTDSSHALPAATAAGSNLTYMPATGASTANVDAERSLSRGLSQPRRSAGV